MKKENKKFRKEFSDLLKKFNISILSISDINNLLRNILKDAMKKIFEVKITNPFRKWKIWN